MSRLPSLMERMYTKLREDIYYAGLRKPKRKGGVTYAPGSEDRIVNRLKALGIDVRDYYIALDDYREYFKAARYLQDFPEYYTYNLPEKSLEHYLSAKLLDLNEKDVYIDVASQNSPVPSIFARLFGAATYRQDLSYPPGLNGDMIGGNAAKMPIPAGFATKAALHCSFEHFEGDSDIQFIYEAARVLKPGGMVCIVPLYINEQYAIQSDPLVARSPRPDFGDNAVIYCAKGWGNRHARFYDPDHFVTRLCHHLPNIDIRVYRIPNFQEVDASCYVRFAMLMAVTDAQEVKAAEELDFWINVWNKKIIETGCWTDDVYSLIEEERCIESYDKQREKEGKAQGYRILALARKPRDYFDGKVVVEVGPGCCGLLEMSKARIKVAIEPLAERFRDNNLLLRNPRGTVYLTCGAESIPLMAAYADIIVASNCLDHVDDISRSVAEMHRILKIGGEVFLNVEIDHLPTPCEPHSLNYDNLTELFKDFQTVSVNKDIDEHGRKWIRAVYRKVQQS